MKIIIKKKKLFQSNSSLNKFPNKYLNTFKYIKTNFIFNCHEIKSIEFYFHKKKIFFFFLSKLITVENKFCSLYCHLQVIGINILTLIKGLFR